MFTVPFAWQAKAWKRPCPVISSDLKTHPRTGRTGVLSIANYRKRNQFWTLCVTSGLHPAPEPWTSGLLYSRHFRASRNAICMKLIRGAEWYPETESRARLIVVSRNWKSFPRKPTITSLSLRAQLLKLCRRPLHRQSLLLSPRTAYRNGLWFTYPRQRVARVFFPSLIINCGLYIFPH